MFTEAVDYGPPVTYLFLLYFFTFDVNLPMILNKTVGMFTLPDTTDQYIRTIKIICIELCRTVHNVETDTNTDFVPIFSILMSVSDSVNEQKKRNGE